MHGELIRDFCLPSQSQSPLGRGGFMVTVYDLHINYLSRNEKFRRSLFLPFFYVGKNDRTKGKSWVLDCVRNIFVFFLL